MLISALLLLSACGLFDGGSIDQSCEDTPEGCEQTGDGGVGDGGGTTPLTIAVDAVEPTYGLMDGGESVSITGGPFAADATIAFGTKQATLRTWQEGELLVLAPSSSSEGWVDVTVTTGDGLGKRTSAYRYFRDGEGKTTALGQFEYLRSVGSLASIGDTASARVGFISPKAGATWYNRYSDGWDSCRRNWDPDLGWEPLDPQADSLDLAEYGGTASLNLVWDAAESHFSGTDGSGQVPTTSLPQGGTWDLLSVDSQDWPAFEIEGFLRMPSTFDLSSPNLETGTSIAQNALSFVWRADTSSSGVLIELTLADPLTGEEIERVSCQATDDGAFTVPSTAFQSWEADKTLYIKIGRTIETVTTLALNGGDVRIVGSLSTMGALTSD